MTASISRSVLLLEERWPVLEKRWLECCAQVCGRKRITRAQAGQASCCASVLSGSNACQGSRLQELASRCACFHLLHLLAA